VNPIQISYLVLRHLLKLLRKPKWTYGEAIKELKRKNQYTAYHQLLNWTNKKGRKGGWDGAFRKAFPAEAKLLWP
jgi:hypothetical protein